MMQGLLQKPMAGAVRGGQPPAEPQPEASEAAMAGNMADSDEQSNVSADEQTQYNRAMAAVMRVLHGSEKSQRDILSQLDPKNPVGSIGQTAGTLIIGLDDQLDFPDSIILPLVEEVVPLLAEMGETTGKLVLKKGQLEQAIATATEVLIDQYGLTDDSYGQVIDGMGPEDLQNLQTVYQGALNDVGE